MHAFRFVGALILVAAHVRAAPVQGAGTEQATQEVLAAEDARFAAMVRADTGALAGMLADDLLYVHSTGHAETKAEFLGRVGSGAIRYLSFVPVERRAILLDDGAAVVQGRANVRVSVGGQPRNFDVRYIAVYNRAGDRWQMRAWQTTAVAPPSG